MPVLAFLIFVGSGVVAAIGLVLLTPATLGVGVIALACYLAIVARLAQASGQHDALTAAVQRRWP